MRLFDVFVDRPVATSLLAIAILLLGVVAYPRMPVASLPMVDLPTVVVRASMPGASPEAMAQSVATPLARQLGVIGGVRELTSISSAGASTLVVQFEIERDIEGAASDVQAAINAAAAALPESLPSSPVYIKANPNVFPVFAFNLTSDVLPPGQLYDLANTLLTQRLSGIPGVARVNVNGAARSALRIQADPAALAARGLGMSDLRSALAAANTHLPKGRLQGGGQSWSIVASDQLLDPGQYLDLIVAWRDRAPVRLRDVATVDNGVADRQQAAWWNDRPAVRVEVFKRLDANIVETVDRIKAELERAGRWLPPAVAMHVSVDQTGTVRAALFDLQLTLLVSIALVVAVVRLFLRRRWATRVPAAVVAVTLSGTLGLMYLAGYSLDNLSVMALIIAVGFVVDDAIIVLEHIAVNLDQGLTPARAARRGVRRMAFTVLSLSFALLAALLPILFMPGVLGRFFNEFGGTLAFAITVSALVSLSLAPSLSARWAGKPQAPPAAWEAVFDRLIARVTRAYADSLAVTLEHTGKVWLALLAVLSLSLLLFGTLPKSLLPVQDGGVIRVITEADPSISFEAMRARQRQVAEVMAADPAVEGLSSTIGVDLINTLNVGRITLRLRPRDRRSDSAEQVMERLRRRLNDVTGMKVYLSLVDDFGVGGRSGHSAYQYTLLGDDIELLAAWAERLSTRLRDDPDLIDVSTDQQGSALEARLQLDRDRAARLGVDPTRVSQTLFDAYGQRLVTNLFEESGHRSLVLEVAAAARADLASLGRMYVSGRDGDALPLSAVTRIDTRLVPVQLNHQGTSPAVTLGFSTRPGVSISQAIERIEAAAREIGLPPQIRGEFAGQAKAAQEAIATQGWLLLGSLVAIYLVLGILYESYSHPLIILSTVPSASLGGVLALWLTATEISFIAMIGLVLVIGLVLKNGILMVDFALAAERQGMMPVQAIKQAAVQRFRPITMTTLAAVLGTLPLAVGIGTGSEMRQPLGIVLVGGLLVAQVLTLYTTPTLYLSLARLRAMFRRQGHAAASALKTER